MGQALYKGQKNTFEMDSLTWYIFPLLSQMKSLSWFRVSKVAWNGNTSKQNKTLGHASTELFISYINLHFLVSEIETKSITSNTLNIYTQDRLGINNKNVLTCSVVLISRAAKSWWHGRGVSYLPSEADFATCYSGQWQVTRWTFHSNFE